MDLCTDSAFPRWQTRHVTLTSESPVRASHPEAFGQELQHRDLVFHERVIHEFLRADHVLRRITLRGFWFTWAPVDRRGVGDFGFQVKRPPMLRHVHVIGSYESYGCSIDTFQLTINVNVTLFV